ncbi:2-polyprenyl-6-methoxyphenol hydroxylase-like FAD-dependent oxidoreductase [Yoonia maricola]|uniref:2-polyprenyl-6-methoxyphenol hydroxylase-like FAD-dependent oxidoreductase n=1 Tax=Yoonia maricola TaxID=420999 RepID=A0A2M8WNU8_9RHOB|nr:NAD(P)/FAD-dependent oxidoreductase [Yoonia maricola]PJI92612.1 2-polyprenyl-6-methoxyphenol hydroxylase-like FAD-dependent oxidoreductase [Yoonia maricola]
MTKRIKIAIAGAGIGGLTAAALLADRGHRVEIFDKFDTPQPVGSGLVIQPVGQAVLDHIGAGDAARALGNPIQRMLGHEADKGRKVLNVWYDKDAGGQFGLGIHRASLFQAIFAAVQARDIKVHTQSQINTARSGMVQLANGRAHGPFDLIVDSAGAGSPLSPLVSQPLPYGAIWGTVDWPKTDLPRTQLSQCYRSANRMIGALPIGKIPGDATPKAAIFWSMPRDSYDTWVAEGIEAWKAEATTLWPAFAPFAAQVRSTDQMTMARYAHGTLRRPWSPGLVHIGDAAHKASPQLGQGANMALLDALALARALDATSGDAALALYTKARRWHVMTYQAMSSAFTPQYQSDSRWLPALRDRLLYPLSQVPPGPRVLTAIVCGTMLPPLRGLGRV